MVGLKKQVMAQRAERLPVRLIRFAYKACQSTSERRTACGSPRLFPLFRLAATLSASRIERAKIMQLGPTPEPARL